MDVKELTISHTGKIKQALKVLDQTGTGILFIVNDQNKILGVITDGDIRRSLLNGCTIEDNISDVMNTCFKSLPVDATTGTILQNINSRIKVIPLLDEEGHLVDYASINKIRKISVAEPLLNGKELAYVTDCIRTGWISSQGKYVRQFEELFTQYHEEYSALAVSNGTVALHLALVALNIGKGDEVIVPDLTFAASVNAIIYTGATPVLVDVDPASWNIDVTKIEALITPNTKAIMPVHLYGHPCDMDSIMAIAKKNKLFVVEDCAESLGSYYHARPLGVFGDVATFSFYGNKTITTGEGGMILFKDSEVAERAAMLRDHGMKKTRRYWHEEVGYNYRLTNIQAAIGVAQFERLEEFVQVKRRIAEKYNAVLGKSDFFQIPFEKDHTRNSFWLYTCLVKSTAPFTRDELIEYLSKQAIETRPVFYPMHIMPPYTGFGKAENLTTSTALSQGGISLPTSVTLADTDLRLICDSLNSFIQKF